MGFSDLRWSTAYRMTEPIDLSNFMQRAEMGLHLSSFKGFGCDHDNVNAEVLSFEARTEYRLAEHLAVGIAYRYMDVSMGATSGGATGQLD